MTDGAASHADLRSTAGIVRSWGEGVMTGLGDALVSRATIEQALAGATSTGPSTWPAPPQSP